MGLILRASSWRPSLSMESRMQSLWHSQIPFLSTQVYVHSSTEITVANALKSSASALEIHFGQSMTRRALTKWGTVRIVCYLDRPTMPNVCAAWPLSC